MITRTAVMLSLLAGPALAGTPVNERRPAAPDGVVRIENPAGNIKVSGWDREEIEITGMLGPGAELAFDGSPRRTRIEVESAGIPHGTPSTLDIKVPAGSRLEIDSFAAGIIVGGVSGTLRAETVNGSISVAGGLREVEVQSVNGSVTVTGAKGRVHAEAVNGSVSLREIGGELEASTVNGTLLAVGDRFDRASLETVSGSMRFEGALGPKGSLDAESVSGSIELTLPGNVAADFAVSTFSGSIENAFGEQPVRKSRWTPQKELNFSTGSGGATISASSISGTITLKKRP